MSVQVSTKVKFVILPAFDGNLREIVVKVNSNSETMEEERLVSDNSE